MIEQAEQQDKSGTPAVEELLDCLLSAGSMKNLPRTGWRLAGIKDCESVADHSFRVVLVALMLGELIEGVDQLKLLKMAVLHELPESMVTDLPLRAVQLLGRETKHDAELRAWERMLPAGLLLDNWRDVWLEFEAGKCLEAKLTRAADKLEMLLQAYEYERVGFRNLDSFWGDENFKDYDLAPLQSILHELKRRRKALWDDKNAQ